LINHNVSYEISNGNITSACKIMIDNFIKLDHDLLKDWIIDSIIMLEGKLNFILKNPKY